VHNVNSNAFRDALLTLRTHTVRNVNFDRRAASKLTKCTAGPPPSPPQMPLFAGALTAQSRRLPQATSP
jgi:hypothetical protein